MIHDVWLKYPIHEVILLMATRNPINSSVQLGSLSHDLPGFYVHPKWLALAFLKHQRWIPQSRHLQVSYLGVTTTATVLWWWWGTETARWGTELGGGNSNIFYFHPYLGKMNPFWQAYFSDGLKPPTSESHHKKCVKPIGSMGLDYLPTWKVKKWPHEQGEMAG